MAGQPDILECGGNPTPVPTGIFGGRRNRRVAGVHQLAAALDSAIYAFPVQAFPSIGVAARGKRRRRGA